MLSMVSADGTNPLDPDRDEDSALGLRRASGSIKRSPASIISAIAYWPK
jgi:hypothetical protein